MAYLNSPPRTPSVCPVCGEDVPKKALACPECGADHRSGWREDADVYDGLDLPDEAFDDESFVNRAFEDRKKPIGVKTIWWIVALVLLLAMILSSYLGPLRLIFSGS